MHNKPLDATATSAVPQLHVSQKRKIKAIKYFVKKLPGVKPTWHIIRNTVYWFRYQSIIRELYPVSTDKELIRFGPRGDGGYLIPDDLDGIIACFSPGVSSISGFEKDCANRGIKVYLADASVDAPAEADSLFVFSKKFIGGHVRKDFITLQQWVDQSVHANADDYMIQMDIEGFEYEVLEHASAKFIDQFRIIVIEFHALQYFSRKKLRVFKKLLATHYCVHIHPNNSRHSVKLFSLEVPPLMEFTFLRKDRIEDFSYRADFPHPLDSDNTSNPSLPLPACWYRQK